MPTSRQEAIWLDQAWALLGEHEATGPATNPRLRDLFADAGHPEIVSDEVAWCAAFVSACLERAHVPSPKTLRARVYLTWGASLDTPRVGAIAVLSRGQDQNLGHVGFYLGETPDAIMILGGNQHDAVSIASFPHSQLLGLRWPADSSATQATSITSPALAPPHPTIGSSQIQAGPVCDKPAPTPATQPDASHVPDDHSLPPPTDAAFSSALTSVLAMEGGYTNDPSDPGGPTNFGITLADYARSRRVPIDDSNRTPLIAGLLKITPAEVAAIYLDRYWRPAGCDRMPPGLALFHFDCAVNMGVGTALRMLQTSLDVTIDGEFGPVTQAQAAQADLTVVLPHYAELRRRRYRSLPTFPRFGRGWLARVDTILARSLTLAPTIKGSPTMPAQTPLSAQPKWWGQSVTIWGALVAGVAAVAPAIGPAFGVEISPLAVHTTADQMFAIAQAVAGLSGTLAAIMGRLNATQPLQQRSLLLKI